MVGYHLANTVTDNGYVSRGVCETNENGELISVTERTRIEKYNGGVAYTEDDGNTWVQVPDDTTVSMNMWGLTPEFFAILKNGFEQFLNKTDMEDLFDRYSTPEMDARKYDATGRGQEKMCYEEGAFDQSLEFYHESKQF